MTSISTTSYYETDLLDETFYVKIETFNDNDNVLISFVFEDVSELESIKPIDRISYKMLRVKFNTNEYYSEGYLFTMEEIKLMNYYLSGFICHKIPEKTRRKAIAFKSFIKNNIKIPKGNVARLKFYHAIPKMIDCN